VANSMNRDKELIEIVPAEFGELTPAEKTLLREAPKGECAQCGPNLSDTDPANDPAQPESWGPDRVIRARLLRWMCIDPMAKERVDPKGVQVHGAVVVGPLDLSFVIVPFPFNLLRCRLTHTANLISAEIPLLGLTGCSIGMLLADRLVTKGDVFLRHGFHAQGWVRLIGAKIGGKLDCVNGTFQNQALSDAEGAGTALSAEGIRVDGDVFLCGEFVADGEVRFRGARIGGDLICAGGIFRNPCQIGVKGSGTALNADGVTVEGSLKLFHGFRAEGEVRLSEAQVGGDVVCDGGTFYNPPRYGIQGNGTALTAGGINVRGDVKLSREFRAEGAVELIGAQIGSDLNCIRGTFSNPAKPNLAGSGSALRADRIGVKGGVHLEESCADGAVKLVGAQIGSDLDCTGGTFSNPAKPNLDESGTALQADRIDVKGSVTLSKGFYLGDVSLPAARIGVNLDCSEGRFEMLVAEGVSVGKNLFWQTIREPARATLNLTNATVDAVVDDRESWPERSRLRLDGFVYGRLFDDPTKAVDRMAFKYRLEWLDRVEPFAPQPYRQLAKVFQETGQHGWARAVLFEMEERLRKNYRGRFARVWRVWRWIVGVVVGYGYKTYRACLWLLGLILLGCGIYETAKLAGGMVPTEKKAFQSFEATKLLPAYYPQFSPLFYSLENSVPLIKLAQADRWQPKPNGQRSSAAGQTWYLCVLSFITTWFRWVQPVIGWVLVTLFVAGLTGIVRSG
jgi:hypothetical protein